MARLLLMLQYLDDALFLARRSLELQAPDRSEYFSCLRHALKDPNSFYNCS